MSFESELSKGQFCIPECLTCKKIVWPPSEFCDKCNGETSLKKEEFEGKIIEFSRNPNSLIFCNISDTYFSAFLKSEAYRCSFFS